MSDIGGDNISCQWSWHGLDDDSSVGAEQCHYFTAETHYTKQGENPCIYRHRGFLCDDGGVIVDGLIPRLKSALGIYIPLIVVNCIILGRAESFASKNPVIPSIFDGLGMGLGFTVALTAIGAVRELLGAGEFFGIPVINKVLGGISSVFGLAEPIEYVPISIFVLAPGAFFVLAALTALQNRVKRKMQEKGQNVDKIQSGCSSDCASCSDSGCAHRFVDVDGAPGSVADAKANQKREG